MSRSFGSATRSEVHTRVIEGDKERIQVYSGIVIGRKGTGVEREFHRCAGSSYGEGVERVFPGELTTHRKD